MRKLLKIVACVVFSFAAFGVHAQIATLDIRSSEYDTVSGILLGSNQTEITYTPSDTIWQSSALELDKDPHTGLPITLEFILGVGYPSDRPGLILTLSSAVTGSALAPGLYSGVVRYDPTVVSGGAQADISFSNSGDNAIWGSFTIEKLDYAANGSVADIDVFFNLNGAYIYGVQPTQNWSGQLIYSAVPEAGTAATFALGLICLCGVRRYNREKKPALRGLMDGV